MTFMDVYSKYLYLVNSGYRSTGEIFKIIENDKQSSFNLQRIEINDVDIDFITGILANSLIRNDNLGLDNNFDRMRWNKALAVIFSIISNIGVGISPTISKKALSDFKRRVLNSSYTIGNVYRSCDPAVLSDELDFKLLVMVLTDIITSLQDGNTHFNSAVSSLINLLTGNKVYRTEFELLLNCENVTLSDRFIRNLIKHPCDIDDYYVLNMVFENTPSSKIYTDVHVTEHMSFLGAGKDVRVSRSYMGVSTCSVDEILISERYSGFSNNLIVPFTGFNINVDLRDNLHVILELNKNTNIKLINFTKMLKERY